MEHILLKARYQRLWNTHCENIAKGYEQASGVRFLHGVTIRVGIKEAASEWSNSGVTGKNAVELFHTSNGILEPEMLWSLCHELGHRLLGQYKLVIDDQALGISWEEANFEAHRILFIFLFDAIRLAFNDELAASILKGARSNYFDNDVGSGSIEAYQKAWLWSDGLSYKRRQQLTRQLFDKRIVILPDN